MQHVGTPGTPGSDPTPLGVTADMLLFTARRDSWAKRQATPGARNCVIYNTSGQQGRTASEVSAPRMLLFAAHRGTRPAGKRGHCPETLLFAALPGDRPLSLLLVAAPASGSDPRHHHGTRVTRRGSLWAWPDQLHLHLHTFGLELATSTAIYSTLGSG